MPINEEARQFAIGHGGTEFLAEEDDEGWEDAEPEEEIVQITCLFGPDQFSDVRSMIQHCKDKHHFDIVSLKDKLALDFLGLVKLVNYIRSEVRTQRLANPLMIDDESVFEDDQYLLPVLEDDALLYSLEDIFTSENVDESIVQESASCGNPEKDAAARVVELEEQLRLLREEFADYRRTVDRTLENRWNNTDTTCAFPRMTSAKPEDTEYFESYSYNEIHEIMLKDTIRTDAYRDFIYDNKDLFNGKVVLDVGCGTGILSMFCARAGASKVIAVDNSDIIDRAHESIIKNGLAQIITCVRGKVEEVSLPVPHVDIIVSEWMGYCLLYEAMLDSVIWARDRYLAPDGLMVPSHTSLHIAPLSDPDYVADHISFWQSVYGFEMTSMLAHIYDEVQVRDVDESDLPALSQSFRQLPLHEIKVDDLTFSECPFSLKLSEDIDGLDGFVIWFDAFFMPSRKAFDLSDSTAKQVAKDKGGVVFTTGPEGPRTHWRQGTLLIDYGDERSHGLGKGSIIHGEICYRKREDHPRQLDIEISWRIEGHESAKKQVWFMR